VEEEAVAAAMAEQLQHQDEQEALEAQRVE
jgi:hypothetical protein